MVLLEGRELVLPPGLEGCSGFSGWMQSAWVTLQDEAVPTERREQMVLWSTGAAPFVEAFSASLISGCIFLPPQGTALHLPFCNHAGGGEDIAVPGFLTAQPHFIVAEHPSALTFLTLLCSLQGPINQMAQTSLGWAQLCSLLRTKPRLPSTSSVQPGFKIMILAWLM